MQTLDVWQGIGSLIRTDLSYMKGSLPHESFLYDFSYTKAWLQLFEQM